MNAALEMPCAGSDGGGRDGGGIRFTDASRIDGTTRLRVVDDSERPSPCCCGDASGKAMLEAAGAIK